MCSRFAGKLGLYGVRQCFAVCLIQVEDLLNKIDEKTLQEDTMISYLVAYLSSYHEKATNALYELA